MAGIDCRSDFEDVPWAAALLEQPDTIYYVPSSRSKKGTTEDSLFAETLRTSRTLKSTYAFYQRPATPQEQIREVNILIRTGNALDGHSGILHGGIVATLIDEGMGILQSANQERNHLIAVQRGLAQGELPSYQLGTFTAELKVKYLKPVKTPSVVLIKVRPVRKEGRKEWIVAEVWHRGRLGEAHNDRDSVLCATGEALFIEPRGTKL
ncbi:hypothetical protein K431DRAFT_284951 [Polychaeton citri CBS 116435]|uniref:Thioesterase domain-containing protein n=1 Tax=Polychaeton citri CBS 116435 TaxID=1314669 RepID=A0A9P4Q7R5_9PEZI|nr:hypothetical protein K431DRAFT_284951 [Polychaeton citri CBS 116435]